MTPDSPRATGEKRHLSYDYMNKSYDTTDNSADSFVQRHLRDAIPPHDCPQPSSLSEPEPSYGNNKSCVLIAKASEIGPARPESHGSSFTPRAPLAPRPNLRRYSAAICVAFLTLASAIPAQAGNVRVTTWNLKWFPNGSPKELPPAEQAARIATAADVLRPLNADIILLQEVRDYDVCARLAEAIKPNTYQVAICSAFKDPFTKGLGKQQVAILAKQPAQAAWSEPWKSMDGVDPPRGFAFAWFKIGGTDVGIYSLHLKSNLIMRGDRVAEGRKNIRKREVAADQLLDHIRDVITPAMPMVRSVVIGGDFNTNPDQAEFAEEKTLATLTAAGFRSSMEETPLVQRITHPGSGRYPDATFDYLFGAHMNSARLLITPTQASDHYPVTCDFAISPTYASARPTPTAPAPKPVAPIASSQTAQSSIVPAPVATLQSAEKATLPPPSSAATQQFATITQPLRTKVRSGETVLPRGLRLAIVSRDDQSVTVKYMDGKLVIPVRFTDLP